MTHPDDLPDDEVWVTSGDVRIPLVELSEKHLRNATNHMKKTLDADVSEDEDILADIVGKVEKLEDEIARRLNIKPPKRSPSQ